MSGLSKALSLKSTGTMVAKKVGSVRDIEGTQVAGHGKDKFNRSNLFFREDKVYKLYDENDPRSKREADFYTDVKNNIETKENFSVRLNSKDTEENLNRPPSGPPKPKIFGKIIPRFFEIKEDHEDGADCVGQYIVMENINHSLCQLGCPSDNLCLADIKIGEPITKYDRDQTKLKNQFLNNCSKKFYVEIGMPDLEKRGFTALGMKFRTGYKEKKPYKSFRWKKLDKYFGRMVETMNYRDAIFYYFLQGSIGFSNNFGQNGYRRKIINDLLAELEEIKDFFEEQDNYQFLGSSLILTYVPSTFSVPVNAKNENDLSEKLTNENLLDKNAPRLAKISLVDFNNVRNYADEDKFEPNRKMGWKDEKCLQGVKNIIKLLEKHKDKIDKDDEKKMVENIDEGKEFILTSFLNSNDNSENRPNLIGGPQSRLFFKKHQTLHLKLSGQNFVNLDEMTLIKNDKSDPYFILRQGENDIYRSEVIENDLNPIWKKLDIVAKFEDTKKPTGIPSYFPFFDPNQPIDILVYDKDPCYDDFIGSVRIENLIESSGSKLELKIESSNEIRGILKVDLAELVPFYYAVYE